jgi:hypothetical protein
LYTLLFVRAHVWLYLYQLALQQYAFLFSTDFAVPFIMFQSYSSMQTCVERWGGPSNHAKANDKGGQFFAARKKPQALRYSFPQMPTHFMVQGEASTPWKRLLSRKNIVLEPRSTSDLNDAIAEFKKFISLPKSPGCILMGGENLYKLGLMVSFCTHPIFASWQLTDFIQT